MFGRRTVLTRKCLLVNIFLACGFSKSLAFCHWDIMLCVAPDGKAVFSLVWYNNLLLTKHEGRTKEYWPKVVAVKTKRSEVHTNMTRSQYSPVWLKQAGFVSSLLYNTRAMLVLNLPACENKKYTAYMCDHFNGNGLYGEIPTKKEPIRVLRFTPRLPCQVAKLNV